jgi:hypothetical protein
VGEEGAKRGEVGDGVYAEGLLDFGGGGGEDRLCVDDAGVVDQDCGRAELHVLAFLDLSSPARGLTSLTICAAAAST